MDSRIQNEHLWGSRPLRPYAYTHAHEVASRRSYLFWSSVTLFVATSAAIVAGAFIQVICDRSQILQSLSNTQLGISCFLLMAVAAGATLHHYSFKAKLRPSSSKTTTTPLQGITVVDPGTPHYS